MLFFYDGFLFIELWVACEWSCVVRSPSHLSSALTPPPSIRFNLLIIFTSMGFVAHSPPNYAAAQTSLGVPFGPVTTELFSSLPLFNRVSWFNRIKLDQMTMYPG